MTITYTGRVANANLFVFSRLLVHWKGSIYKLVYKEMLIFCVLYAMLSLTYRIALTDDQKRYVALFHCMGASAVNELFVQTLTHSRNVGLRQKLTLELYMHVRQLK